MKVLIPIKRVVDSHIKIRVKPDHSGVELDHIKMSMNPFDEVAVEAAVQLFEKGKIKEIVVVSIGSIQSKEILRNALARGAHRAILIKTDDSLESLSVARILHALVMREDYSLIFTGKQAIDTDAAQTGSMLAGLLGWSQGCFSSNLDVYENYTVVKREIDGGTEDLELTLPAVVTVDLNFCEPRYISLTHIMSAKKKSIEEYDVNDFGVDLSPHLQVITTEEHKTYRSGMQMECLSEFIAQLKKDIAVL